MRVHVLTWWLGAALLSFFVIQTHTLAVSLSVTAIAIVISHFMGSDSPWRGALRISVLLAIYTIIFRIVFTIAIGTGFSPDTLFTLPQVKTPSWMTGLIIGGPVSQTRLIAAFNSAAVLATVIILIGAAQTLTSPRRVLRALPPMLYEFGLVIVIATSLVPQFVTSIQRTRRAFYLRGIAKPPLLQVATPIIEDCLDRTLAIAASMDVRGFGSSQKRTRFKSEKFSLFDFLILVGLLTLVVAQ